MATTQGPAAGTGETTDRDPTRDDPAGDAGEPDGGPVAGRQDGAAVTGTEPVSGRATWWRSTAAFLRRPVVLVILAAVLAGAFLRVPLAHVGLPYLRDPDEPLAPRVSAAMLVEGRVDAGYYNYPGLMFDLGALVLAPFVDDDTPLAAVDHPVAATQTQGNSLSHRPGVLVALRWTVGVLPGLVAVATAGVVAWLATRRWWVAGLAASLMALSPLDLTYGRYVTPNALAGATSGLVVLAASWLLLSRPRASRYLLAGAAVGLAGAAKYNAVLAAASVVVAHVLATVDQDGRGWRAWRAWLSGRELWRQARLLLAAAAACLAVFLLLNPGAVLDTQLFVDGVQFESEHYRRGHAGNEGDSPEFHLSALWRGFGPALLLAPLALVARDRTIRRVALTAWSFVLPYVAFISSFEVRFARNLLPVTVPLAVTAALGAVAVAGHARHLTTRRTAGAGRAAEADRSTPVTEAGAVAVTGAEAGAMAGAGAGPGTGAGRPSPAAVALAGALGVALLVWPAVEARATLDAAIPDPWAPAQRWLESHVPAGERVAVESYGVHVDPDRYDVLTVGSMIEDERDAAWYRENGYTLLVASERTYQRFLDEPERYGREAGGYRALLEQTCTRFAAGPDDEQVVLLDPSCADPAGS